LSNPDENEYCNSFAEWVKEDHRVLGQQDIPDIRQLHVQGP